MFSEPYEKYVVDLTFIFANCFSHLFIANNQYEKHNHKTISDNKCA